MLTMNAAGAEPGGGTVEQTDMVQRASLRDLFASSLRLFSAGRFSLPRISVPMRRVKFFDAWWFASPDGPSDPGDRPCRCRKRVMRTRSVLYSERQPPGQRLGFRVAASEFGLLFAFNQFRVLVQVGRYVRILWFCLFATLLLATVSELCSNDAGKIVFPLAIFWAQAFATS